MELDIHQLKNLKIYNLGQSYSIALIDNEDFEITKGYGPTFIDALNDMHDNLI